MQKKNVKKNVQLSTFTHITLLLSFQANKLVLPVVQTLPYRREKYTFSVL